jgi:uncharacterized RDD family membrane protein YckC
VSDDPRTPPPDDQPPARPFPESSLGPASDEPSPPPPPHGDPLQQADPPPGLTPEADPPPVPDSGLDAPPEPPRHQWVEPPSAPPYAPPPQPAAQYTPPAGPGMASGDPLAGAATQMPSPPPQSPPVPAPAPPAYPSGYSSPPPPGVGGPAPAGPTFAGRYVLAGWWRRVGAALIDGTLIFIVALAFLIPLGIGVFGASSSGSDTGTVATIVGFFLAVLVFALVSLAYAPVMMGKTNGKTLGRMATGIRVVRADGKPITYGFAALREVVVKALLINGVAGSFTFGLAGLLDVLWPLWDDENRALHDFVVNTRTVLDQ